MESTFEKCQKFTPTENVKFTLDYINYCENIFNRSVLENSCGDGNFLVEIVERYIKDGIRQGFNRIEIKESLETNIYAAEVDDKHYKKCQFRLKELCSIYGIYNVKWNLIKDDVLKYDFHRFFDYVIGNPPYIIYRRLSSDIQSYLKDNFISCQKGQFDYCYAFIEYGVDLLNANGILAYIVPNSILKNTFAENLREYIRPFLLKIYDYENEQQFKNALTSSMLLVLKNNIDSEFFELDGIHSESKVILKRELGIKWRKDDSSFGKKAGMKRFGDYFTIANSIATLKNEVYVLRNCIEYSDLYYLYNGYLIERELVKNACSPRSIASNIEEKIIFPYVYQSGKLKRYEKKLFERKFPMACMYLRSVIKELENRKSDNSAEWFEYGRSQALKNMNQPKLLISQVFTNNVNVYMLDSETIPYSGFYIIKKSQSEFDLEFAMNLLQTKRFREYIHNVGINTAGTSLRLSVKDISDYYF